MKLRFQFILGLAAMLFAFLPAPPARAQLVPTDLTFALTNLVGVPVTVAAGSSNAISGPVEITLKQGVGFAAMPHFASTNLSTNVIVGFLWQVSVDGTNWATTDYLVQTNLLNGSTAVRGYKLFAPSVVDHARKVRLYAITNGGVFSAFITNVTVSIRPQ